MSELEVDALIDALRVEKQTLEAQVASLIDQLAARTEQRDALAVQLVLKEDVWPADPPHENAKAAENLTDVSPLLDAATGTSAASERQMPPQTVIATQEAERIAREGWADALARLGVAHMHLASAEASATALRQQLEELANSWSRNPNAISHAQLDVCAEALRTALAAPAISQKETP